MKKFFLLTILFFVLFVPTVNAEVDYTKWIKFDWEKPQRTFQTIIIGKELVKQKEIYQQYQDEYNLAKKYYDAETDTNKKFQWEQKMIATQKNMKSTGERSKSLIDSGSTYLINADLQILFGSNVNLIQAKVNLDAMKRDAINQILFGKYSKSADQFFEDEYQNYRQQGRSDREATILTGQKAKKHQANRVAFYEQAQYALGFDDDAHTKMNFIGQKMQSRIEEEGFK